MLKQLQAGLSKFFTKKWIPIIVILVICFVIMTYSSSKAMVLDKMTDYGAGMGSATAAPTVQTTASTPVAMSSAKPMTPQSAATASAPVQAPPSAPVATGYAAAAVANPSDLLPIDKNSQWATLNPSGNNVAIPDLLQAGYHIGLDTIGQTLKNANYQLRSDPIIEKREVSPWMQSTIEPDYGRIPLEVGYGQR